MHKAAPKSGTEMRRNAKLISKNKQETEAEKCESAIQAWTWTNGMCVDSPMKA